MRLREIEVIIMGNFYKVLNMNKISKFITLATSVAVLTLSSNGVKAQSAGVFTCETIQNGIPTTYMSAVTGKKIELISWQKEGLGNYSKQERCQIVTQRFQEAYQDGSLAYMTDGFMGGQKVICGTSSQGGSCEKLLLTLRPEDNAKEVIESFFTAGSYSSSPVIQSNGQPRYYYSFNELMNK